MKNRLFILITIWGGIGLAHIPYASPAQEYSEPLFRSAASYDAVLVERVISGDRLSLRGGEKIKLIGIKAPRVPKRKHKEVDKHGLLLRKPKPEDVTIEDQAFDFVRNLLYGKTVRLEFDAQLKDDNFDTLAYVFLPDGTFVNAEILRYGFADLKIRPPNTKYASRLREAYQEARKEKRGLRGQ